MKKIVPLIHKRSDWHQILALCSAGIFTVLAILQLFWFEDFPDELGVLLPAEWAQANTIFAAAFVIAEVFAVAYFLPIALSPLARWCTRVLAWLVPISWIAIMVYTFATHQAANTAYLGAKLGVPLGWVSTFAMVALFIMVAIVTISDLRKS